MISLADIDWRPNSPAIVHPRPLPLDVKNKFGVYPWWPECGERGIHPDDVEVVANFIPSDRVFRRLGTDGEFLILSYGDVRFRIQPTLCWIVKGDGLNIGDQVEILPRHGKNEPGVGFIFEMRWRRKPGVIDYHIRRGEQVIPRPFCAEDLRAAPLQAEPMFIYHPQTEV